MQASALKTLEELKAEWIAKIQAGSSLFDHSPRFKTFIYAFINLSDAIAFESPKVVGPRQRQAFLVLSLLELAWDHLWTLLVLASLKRTQAVFGMERLVVETAMQVLYVGFRTTEVRCERIMEGEEQLPVTLSRILAKLQRRAGDDEPLVISAVRNANNRLNQMAHPTMTQLQSKFRSSGGSFTESDEQLVIASLKFAATQVVLASACATMFGPGLSDRVNLPPEGERIYARYCVWAKDTATGPD